MTFLCQKSANAVSPRTPSERDAVEKGKRLGQVFTPNYIVVDILNTAGYSIGKPILRKHVIDNSCGKGAFLTEIVRRYCIAFLRVHKNHSKKMLVRELEEFIHGIEIDKEAYHECLNNLNKVLIEFKIPYVKWDVRNADALEVDAYNGKMDFVVGNPPYVRVHNLDKDFNRVKQYRFCNSGMTDLYLLFYEIGLKMLAPEGHLCYITPSSWINSVAGKSMRDYLYQTGSLCAIIDLQHFQPFPATAYTAITLLSNANHCDRFSYSVYDAPGQVRFVAELSYEDAFFDEAIYLGDVASLRELRKIKSVDDQAVVEVKNGFATLADEVFIADEFKFDKMLIPVIKGSTGKWRKAFYPYNQNGKPLDRNEIFADERIAKYLNDNKAVLLKGKSETDCSDWYLYGRTQALKDVWVDKYSINTVVRDVDSIKLHFVPSGSGVYSGLYIITKIPEARLREALLSREFVNYIVMLKKYKSGGYYTFSSKELRQYLNYKLSASVEAPK